MREIRTSGSVGASGSNLRGDPTPPPQLRSILRKRQEAWDGEESEGELFEQIRREYEFGIGTVKGVARKLCSRAMLDDAQGAACISYGRTDGDLRARGKVDHLRPLARQDIPDSSIPPGQCVSLLVIKAVAHIDSCYAARGMVQHLLYGHPVHAQFREPGCTGSS